MIIPAFWAFTGFGVITFTAGLTALPSDLVEAAKVDGAGPLQIVRYVIIPSLRRPMIVVLVQMVIFALRTFDIVYVMTGGGPAEDTMVLALLLWLQAFEFLDSPQAGQSAAIAVLLTVVMVVAAYPYLRQRNQERPAMTGLRLTRRAAIALYAAATLLAVVWLVPVLERLGDLDNSDFTDPERLVERGIRGLRFWQLRACLGGRAVLLRSQQLHHHHRCGRRQHRPRRVGGLR